jgi:hypothetical protein
MKLKIALSIFLISILPATAFAYSDYMATMPNKIILNEPSSNFMMPNHLERVDLQQHAIMPVGRWRGLPVELFERRPPVITRGMLYTSEGLKIYNSNIDVAGPVGMDDVVVANVEHLGKFYLAVVPLSAVQSLDMTYSKFMPIAAHYLTIFNFDPARPVRLIGEVLPPKEGIGKGVPQIKMLGNPILLENLVLSIEGTYAYGHSGFDLAKGLQGNFTNTFLLTSTASRLKEYVDFGRSQERVRANFTQRETFLILNEALHSADRAGLNFLYNTLIRNCTSQAMEIYERAVPLSGRHYWSGEIGRAAVMLGAATTFMGKVYPIFNEFYGTAVRHYHDPSVQLTRLEDDPRMQVLLEQMLNQNPNSPVHAIREKLECDRALREAMVSVR